MIAFFNPPEDEINFNSFIKFSSLLFRLMFFNFEPSTDNRPTKRQALVNILKKIFIHFCIGAQASAVICAVGYAINSDDLVTTAGSLLDTLVAVLVEIKFLTVYFRKSEITTIINECRSIFEERTNNKDYGVKKCLNDYHFYIKIFAGTVVMVSLPVAFVIVPYFINGRMELALKYWFPFDITPTTFPIVSLWTDFVVWNSMVFLLSSDSLLYALMTVLAMEFDILKIDLMKFSHIPKHERSGKIKSLIDRHNKLLDIGSKLQDIYSLIFLISFAVSSMIMCFIAFQLTTADGDIFVYTLYVPYMGFMVEQVLLLCSLGQKLIDSSESVADAGYGCEWETFNDTNFKKNFVPIMIRAQRPMRLTAMGFTDISLVTFTTIMSATGSYFSLMKNIYSNE